MATKIFYDENGHAFEAEVYTVPESPKSTVVQTANKPVDQKVITENKESESRTPQNMGIPKQATGTSTKNQGFMTLMSHYTDKEVQLIKDEDKVAQETLKSAQDNQAKSDVAVGFVSEVRSQTTKEGMADVQVRVEEAFNNGTITQKDRNSLLEATTATTLQDQEKALHAVVNRSEEAKTDVKNAAQDAEEARRMRETVGEHNEILSPIPDPTPATSGDTQQQNQQPEPVEYWVPVTTDSSKEDKSKPAEVFATPAIDDGADEVPVTSSQYLKYLQNPQLMTDRYGGNFARSDVGSTYLSGLKPSEQNKAVTTMSEIMKDENQCTLVSNPGEPPNPGDYVMKTNTNGVTSTYYINPKTEDGKNLLKDMHSKNLVTGGPTGSTSTSASSGAGQTSGTTGSDSTQLGKANEEPKSKTFNEETYKKNEQLLTIGHFSDIPYFRVNGYSKLKFPNVWDTGRYHIPIMGLPPTRIQKRPEDPIPMVSRNAFDLVGNGVNNLLPEMYVYDEDAQLNNSFLKLTIHPIDVEFLNGANGDKEYKNKRYNAKGGDDNSQNQYAYKDRSVVIWDVEYNFAVQVKENNITINHTNNYKASSLEGMASSFEGSGTVSELVRNYGGLSHVIGGASQSSKTMGAMLNKVGGASQAEVNKLINALQRGATDSDVGFSPEQQALANQLVSDLGTMGKELVNVFSGARIDMPDVWTSSSTGVQYQVTIELRTMCPDPLDIQYHKDILIPLYILYTLALPQDTGKVTYKTPPYIYCNLDKFFKIKLGAIINMTVDLHLDEVNFRRAPRHVTVSLTIRDLYSVMKQDVWDEHNKKIDSENGDTTDKDEFINNFVKYAEDLHDSKKVVTNEPYYLTEFARIPAYLMALEDYKKEQQKKLAEKQNKASVNSQKGSKLGLKGVSADVSKVAQSINAAADKVVQVKDGNFITSIGNAITSVTKGVKNIIAGTQKALPQVRNLINTGKMVMTSVNGLKSAVKLIGQTANLDGILNGQFASSVGFAFSNIANATDVVEKISNGCLSGKGSKSVVNAVGQIPQEVLTTDVANCITDTGSLNLSDQIRNSACSMYALANMFGSTYANVIGLKNLGSSGGDIFDKAQSLFENLGGIANGVDSFMIGQSVGSTPSGIIVDPVMQKYVTAMTRGMIDKGITTANNVSSNTKLQKEINNVSQIGTRIITDPEKVKEVTAIFESANEKAFQAEVNAIKKTNGVSDQVAKGIATARMFINQNL